MNFSGLDVKNLSLPRARCPSRLLYYETYRVGLVKEPNFPIFVLLCPRVTVDPALNQDVVNVGDESTDVPSLTGNLASLTVAHPHRLGLPEVVLHRLVEGVEVGLIEADDRARQGDPHVGVSMEELLPVRVECEPIYSFPHRKDQDGSGGVETVTASHHIRTALKEGTCTSRGEILVPVDTKDGADRKRRV